MPQQGDDTAEYPQELLCLLGKTFLFKIQITKDNIEDPEGTKFQVQRICDDELIIQTFLTENQLHQVIHQNLICIYLLVDICG